MISVTMALFLRVHVGVDVRVHRDAHEVDCHVGIHVTFSFCIHTQGRTTRAAKVTATQFSNVRYFSVTVGQGEAV